MNVINYFSSLIIPFFILIILYYGFKEKINMYDSFLEGCKEGIEVVITIFPNLLALFLAITVFQSSGILTFIEKLLSPICSFLLIPTEIIPLAILRPISGSGSMAILQSNLELYGVDSYIGKVAATIMGAAETTFFTIAIYSSVLKTKMTKSLVIAAVFADIVVIICSIYIYQIF